MNTKLIKLSFLMIISILLLNATACKSKTTEDPAPARKLDKTALTNNKMWYNKDPGISFNFKSNGVFSYDGTWRWVNNSDTMEIVMAQGEDGLLWKFYWNDDKEMLCRWINNEQDILFTSTK